MRNKYTESVVGVLQELGADTSCVQALPFAVKEKREQRGTFATQCIEFVDEELRASVKALSEKIDGHAQYAAEKTKAAEDAAEEVKRIEVDVAAKVDGKIEADNASFALSEERKAINGVSKQLDSRAKELAAILDAKQSEYGCVESELARLEILFEGGKAALVPTGEVAEDKQDSMQKPLAGNLEDTLAIEA